MRLDRFLADMGVGTRSELRKIIGGGRVSVNNKTVKKADLAIDAKQDEIMLDGVIVRYEPLQYIMLNKPAGIITASFDKHQKTVMDVLGQSMPDTFLRKDLEPVGRLDRDTEGLLILTNDGQLNHRMLSPKSHIEKEYYAELKAPVTAKDIEKIRTGFEIPESEKGNDAFLSMPARISLARGTNDSCFLAIQEGKYHQIKRMFLTLGNEVTYLKRVRMGALTLDETLAPGEARFLTAHEKDLLLAEKITPLKDLGDGKYRAVLLDMDGTILDSMGMWYDIDKAFFERHELDMPADLQKQIEGLSFRETAVYFLEHFDLPGFKPKDLMKEWTQMAADQYRHHLKLKPFVMDFLNLCKEKGIRLGIATSNEDSLAEECLKANGVYDYFDKIMASSSVEKGKPAPDIYLSLAQYLNIPLEQCLVFEDILPGIEAGKNAGMKTVAVEDEYSKSARAAKMNAADYFIDGFDEILF